MAQPEWSPRPAIPAAERRAGRLQTHTPAPLARGAPRRARLGQGSASASPPRPPRAAGRGGGGGRCSRQGHPLGAVVGSAAPLDDARVARPANGRGSMEQRHRVVRVLLLRVTRRLRQQHVESRVAGLTYNIRHNSDQAQRDHASVLTHRSFKHSVHGTRLFIPFDAPLTPPHPPPSPPPPPPPRAAPRAPRHPAKPAPRPGSAAPRGWARPAAPPCPRGTRPRPCW